MQTLWTYMPPGFFMLDITSGKQMVTGFRASVLVAAPQLDDLKAIFQTVEGLRPGCRPHGFDGQCDEKPRCVDHHGMLA